MPVGPRNYVPFSNQIFFAQREFGFALMRDIWKTTQINFTHYRWQQPKQPVTNTTPIVQIVELP